MNIVQKGKGFLLGYYATTTTTTTRLGNYPKKYSDVGKTVLYKQFKLGFIPNDTLKLQYIVTREEIVEYADN